MTQVPENNNTTEVAAVETPDHQDNAVTYRSSLLSWVTILLTVGAWVVLMWWNGYAAAAVAAAAVVVGFISLPGRSASARNLSITGIIASTVLLVVIVAFVVVIRIVLAGS